MKRKELTEVIEVEEITKAQDSIMENEPNKAGTPDVDPIATAIEQITKAQDSIMQGSKIRVKKKLYTGTLAQLSRELTAIKRRLSKYV